MHIAIARIKIRLRILPIPKYIKMRNKDNEEEAMNPRRVLANNNEEVKSKTEKVKTKNTGTAPKVSGSTK